MQTPFARRPGTCAPVDAPGDAPILLLSHHGDNQLGGLTTDAGGPTGADPRQIEGTSTRELSP